MKNKIKVIDNWSLSKYLRDLPKNIENSWKIDVIRTFRYQWLLQSWNLMLFVVCKYLLHQKTCNINTVCLSASGIYLKTCQSVCTTLGSKSTFISIAEAGANLSHSLLPNRHCHLCVLLFRLRRVREKLTKSQWTLGPHFKLHLHLSILELQSCIT